jgi:hypothetical protein
MGLTVAETGGNFTPAPEGTFIARCVQVIDLGTQTSGYYKNQDGTPQKAHKVMLGWEIPGELTEDGKPFLVWKRYTASLNEKANLRAHLESWRGRKFTEDELAGFQLPRVLDAPCLINVTHSVDGNNTYANITSVMAMPKGQNAPPRFHPLVEFDLDRFDHDVFTTFSDNLKKTIDSSDERRGVPPQQRDSRLPPPDDEVPF